MSTRRPVSKTHASSATARSSVVRKIEVSAQSFEISFSMLIGLTIFKEKKPSEYSHNKITELARKCEIVKIKGEMYRTVVTPALM